MEVFGSLLSGRDLRGRDILTFVTVGNAVPGFNRLMEAIERLNEEGLLEKPVVVQHGNSTKIPRDCTSVSSLSHDEFGKYVAGASLIITHGGAGSIGRCLQAGKKPIVVPRRKRFGEVVNDHQVQLVSELEAQGRIFAAYEVSNLPSIVRIARESRAAQSVVTGGEGVKAIVKDFLDRLADGKAARG